MGEYEIARDIGRIEMKIMELDARLQQLEPRTEEKK